MRRSKANHATWELALSAMNVAGLGAVSYTFLLDKRSKALDQLVVAAARRAGVPGDAHLSPPLRGERYNRSPTLASLADPHHFTRAWDERKVELLRQFHSGTVHVAGDPTREPYRHLQLPPKPARAPARPALPALPAPSWWPEPALAGRRALSSVEAPVRDLRRAKPNRPPGVFAHTPFVVYDDDGNAQQWGAAAYLQAGSSTAHPLLVRLFQGQNGSWALRFTGHYQPRFGRVDLSGDVDPYGLEGAVADAAGEALARTPQLGALLTRRRSASDAFRGTDPPKTAWASARARSAFNAAANAACVHGGRTLRAGTQKHQRWQALHAAAEAARLDVCGESGPIPEGGPCDELLSALEGSHRPACAIRAEAPCPRRLSREDAEVLAQRAGDPDGPAPADWIGPFETARRHDIGADPCCIYHPLSIERQALRQRVVAQHSEDSEADLLAAIRSTERWSQHADVWAACDARAREEVLATVPRDHLSGAGGGAEPVMATAIAFYKALRADDPNAAVYWWRLQQEDLRLAGVPMPEDASSAEFLDVLHEIAHESGNPGYLRWAHARLGKSCTRRPGPRKAQPSRGGYAARSAKANARSALAFQGPCAVTRHARTHQRPR